MEMFTGPRIQLGPTSLYQDAWNQMKTEIRVAFGEWRNWRNWAANTEVPGAHTEMVDRAAERIEVLFDALELGARKAEVPPPPVFKGHVLLTSKTCPCPKDVEDRRCPVCDWGLDVCSLCGAAEAQLSDPCQGPKP